MIAETICHFFPAGVIQMYSPPLSFRLYGFFFALGFLISVSVSAILSETPVLGKNPHLKMKIPPKIPPVKRGCTWIHLDA